MRPERPSGIKATTWLMALLNTSFMAALDWSASPAVLAVAVFVVLASYPALWFYWQGRNWARKMVLLCSLLASWNLAFWTSSNLVDRVLIAVEAPLGLFLLYWLNTPTVKAYFVTPPKSASHPAAEPRP